MGPGYDDAGGYRPETFRLVMEALEWNWGEAYKLAVTPGGAWTAARRDDGKVLSAKGPEQLKQLIFEDYSARPVPR